MTAIDFLALADPFPPEDLDWRIGQKSKAGDKASLLVYLTARAVMQRLDDVAGPERWRTSFTPLTEGVKIVGYMCNLEIEVEPGKWVGKVDGADITDIEAIKGGISSALKRAASQWGCGRYLYFVDSRYHPIKSGYAPDSVEAVYCPTNDGKPGHVVVPKLDAKFLPKPKKGKGKTIDTTPTPEDQALADRIAAEKEAARAAKEAAEAARKAKHHPSWAGVEQRTFFATVGELGFNPDLACDLVERSSRDKLRPSAMDVAQWGAAIAWLRSPKGKAAYTQLVEEREREQVPA